MDYHLQPKVAYYAIKRELADMTINTKRTIEEIPADKYTHAYIKKVHKMQVFSTNLSLNYHQYSLRFRGWDIRTGELRFSEQRRQAVTLKPNQSTEICEYELGDGEAASRIVVAVYLIEPEDGQVVARSISWPEPLKYVPFPPPKNLRIDSIGDQNSGDSFEIECDVPIKGFVLEVDNDTNGNIVFEDNCIDLVPGEAVLIGVKGLELLEKPKITYRYLKAAIDL